MASRYGNQAASTDDIEQYIKNSIPINTTKQTNKCIGQPLYFTRTCKNIVRKLHGCFRTNILNFKTLKCLFIYFFEPTAISHTC